LRLTVLAAARYNVTGLFFLLPEKSEVCQTL